jgi:trimethylamine:corrinoid methyltransferase-like protein
MGEDWYPALFDHRSFDKWQELGGHDLAARAAARVDEILATHEVPALPEDTAAGLDEIVDHRRRTE